MPKAPLLLRGKTAVITGAGSGIGRALAVEASRRGTAVALVGRRAAALEETRSLLGPTAACPIIPGDITSPATRFAVRDRVARDWGVNFGSLVGDMALPLFAAYSASKFGLRGLSNALRRELKGLGIGVTYGAPRGARTNATQRIAPFMAALEMPLDSPTAIAAQAWDAVERGDDSVYPRGRERLYVLLERLFPSIVTRALTAQFERAGFGAVNASTGPAFPRAAAGQPQTPQSPSTHDGS